MLLIGRKCSVAFMRLHCRQQGTACLAIHCVAPILYQRLGLAAREKGKSGRVVLTSTVVICNISRYEVWRCEWYVLYLYYSIDAFLPSGRVKIQDETRGFVCDGEWNHPSKRAT